jgi:hypothetical protein
MNTYFISREKYEYIFKFNYMIKFRNYFCVQQQLERPFEIIAVWKIKRLQNIGL